MKNPKIFVIVWLIGHGLMLTAQTNPVAVDLYSKGVKLDAKFYPANDISKAPAVILLHGFPGNQSSPLGLADRLNKAGFNILVFNYQGSYSSEGNFSFDNCIDNVNAAKNFLLEKSTEFNIDTSSIVVCDYSFGGTIAIESGMYVPGVRKIIAIANDDHSVSIKKAMNDPQFKENYIKFVGQLFGTSGPFRGDLKSLMEYNIAHIDGYDLVNHAENLISKKILFIIGWQDNTSQAEVNILPLYRKLMQVNKENTHIKGFETDHRFGNVMDELTGVIIEWIRDDSGSKNKTTDEIFKTEKAFEKMTAEKGIAEAFYFFADENAVIKREKDTLISGKENIRNYYEKRNLANATVNWEPDFIDVSASGDLAYTYGEYIWKVRDDSGKTAEYRGVFHTVWKRQHDGSWKYVWD